MISKWFEKIIRLYEAPLNHNVLWLTNEREALHNWHFYIHTDGEWEDILGNFVLKNSSYVANLPLQDCSKLDRNMVLSSLNVDTICNNMSRGLITINPTKTLFPNNVDLLGTYTTVKYGIYTSKTSDLSHTTLFASDGSLLDLLGLGYITLTEAQALIPEYRYLYDSVYTQGIPLIGDNTGILFKTINGQSIFGEGEILIEGGGTFTQVQADWTEEDMTKKSFIKHKPTLFSGDYNDLINKPDIPEGSSIKKFYDSTMATPLSIAGVGNINVRTVNGLSIFGEGNINIDAAQSDWLVNDATSLAYIKNKPAIPNNTLTIKRNNVTLGTYTAGGTDTTINISVPTQSQIKTIVEELIGYLVPAGSITMWAGTEAPTGWLLCDGSLVDCELQIVDEGLDFTTAYNGTVTKWKIPEDSDYRNLILAIKAIYTDSYAITLNKKVYLPDFRQRFPLGAKNGTMNNGFNATGGQSTVDTNLGKKGGSSEVTLSMLTLPSHEHSIVDYDGDNIEMEDPASGSGFYFPYTSTLATATKGLPKAAATGGSLAHANMPPYIAINFIIKY